MSATNVSRVDRPEPGKKASPSQVLTNVNAADDATPTMKTISSQPAQTIQRLVTADRICVLTFDRPDSSANVFDRAALLELSEHLDFVAANAERSAQPTPLRGLVLASAKNSIFIAGADLHALADLAVEELRSLIELGQAVFGRLARLPIPTVTAIHGACVGGGYEICLACDYRVASPDRITKIGLPETQLGLLPAWGGSSRLPRLIGLPKALEVILGGKVLAAKQALKYGMIDELVPREFLLNAARRKIEQGKPRRSTWYHLNNVLVATTLNASARAKVLSKTRGHYPAVTSALGVVTKGVSRSLEESLKLETEAMLELAPTEACRNLVRIFLLQERAKKLSLEETLASAGSPLTNPIHELTPRPLNPSLSPSDGEKVAARPGEGRIVERTKAAAPPSVKRAVVVGAGVMGAGIAQWLSARGLAVILRDVNVELVAKGMANIAGLYDEGTKRHLFTRLEARTGLDRIFPTATEVSLTGVDLVIEAAVETMEVKKQIFHRLDELAAPTTILATNTSALSVSEIAESTKMPERVVGIHFFNPVHRMQLVEVVVGRRTDREVIRRSLQFVQRIGKLPVLVNDSPGFLVNRILMPYLIEAGDLFDTGARTEDIDEAMLEFGMPMGPLRLIDEVGVDVAQHVAQTLGTTFSDRLHVPPILAKMLQGGLLGRKSGHGFYLHRSKTSEVNSGILSLRRGDSAERFSREQLQKRMVLQMVNEAVRCLEEKVVSAPDDVDFAMIMGTGFAPFRGGPLRYIDSAGADKLVAEMKRLVEAGATHFEPCALLESMAREGRKFY
jgi:3-hydroxyacyl-CoA dehydrogenase/enoyl-CoA hydratase/3-hydroxybutyryl-CoA epimerase